MPERERKRERERERGVILSLAMAMELRELGKTGLKVSLVGFGASPLGNVFGQISPEEAVASVRTSLRLGINFFDTSPFYGGTVSESVLGRCLEELKVAREEIVVSTKCGRYANGFDFSAERVTRSIDESLARLRLDYVDILQCHDIEFGDLDQLKRGKKKISDYHHSPQRLGVLHVDTLVKEEITKFCDSCPQIVNETIPALQKLKEAGKIRFIGITGLPLSVFTYVLDRVPPGSVDAILSYCHYSINDTTLIDLVPYLKGKGVGVITASPLAMGLLTEGGPPDWHPASPELKSACSAATLHCKEKGKNISKLALQYSLMNKDISTVLVGMNSVRQVEENISAALELLSTGIDDELLSEVEAILQPVKNQTWPSGIQKS